MSTVIEPSAVWAYAVAEHVRPACLDELEGVGGGPVRAVTAAGLTAIAGDAPAAEFGEAALRRNLENLAWLEATARAHHRVIEALAGEAPVVPMRLATVYRDDAGTAASLTERAGDLRAALARIRAHKEWGIKAYAARPAGPGAAGDPDPAPRDSGRRPPAPGRPTWPGGARNCPRTSAPAATWRPAPSRFRPGWPPSPTRAWLHPPQSPQLAGHSAQMILNAAYLVADEREGDFAAAVADLAGGNPAVRIEITGPWPPYSFAGLPEPGQP